MNQQIKNWPYRDDEHRQQVESRSSKRSSKAKPPPMTPEVQAIYDHNAREIDEMLKRGECHPCGS